MECTLLKYVKTNDGERLSDELITMISRYLRSPHPCARMIPKLEFHRTDDDLYYILGDTLRVLDPFKWPPQYQVVNRQAADRPFILIYDGEPYAWPGERAAMEAARRRRYGSCTSIGYYDSDDGF
jgi:hypothetical protein